NSVTWAQAGRALPRYGTTHADGFYGAVPCTRALYESQIKENYEEETGKVIVETFDEQEVDPLVVPGVLVYEHGPFN
ncbi:L-ribulose-5-phosphate 4-epimerase, partial [Enterococcus faecalis]